VHDRDADGTYQPVRFFRETVNDYWCANQGDWYPFVREKGKGACKKRDGRAYMFIFK